MLWVVASGAAGVGFVDMTAYSFLPKSNWYKHFLSINVYYLYLHGVHLWSGCVCVGHDIFISKLYIWNMMFYGIWYKKKKIGG